VGLTYVDSCILIDALMVGDARGARAREILEAGHAEDRLVISPLVELECLVRPLRAGDQRRIKSTQSRLDRFQKIPVSNKAFRVAAELRARHRFQTADAINVATAGEGGCTTFWTTDKALLRVWPHFMVNPYEAP